MADKLKFQLVSPERLLAETEAEAVTIPGQLGDMTAMVNHAPFLTTLRPGFVTVSGGGEGRYFVTGGFVEVADNTVSVLAEQAVEASAVTADWLQKHIEEAERLHGEAGPERAQATLQRLNDFRALAAQI